MAALSSAVARVRNYDDDVSNSTESSGGIFVMPHYHNRKYIIRTPTECERMRSNMFPSAKILLLMLQLVAATFIQYLVLSSVTEAANIHTPIAPTASSVSSSTNYGRECLSMDIRNDCSSLHQLDNCTVVTGFIIISSIDAKVACNYGNYSFPKLREITDFILFHSLETIKSFRTLFPNLTVIRGRRLFLNYAVGISRNTVLSVLEFPSLVAIQRGHVYIASSPHLCYLDTINFDRLTLTTGENHIMSTNETACAKIEQPCRGCDSGYCWSNMVCQKFENDNILSLQEGIQHCDTQCLGGCRNRTARGCAVCRSWTDHGTCVEKCPDDKYASEHYLRCYTREECLAKHLNIYKNECLATCPTGYKLNNATRECDSCGGVNDCLRSCILVNIREDFGIYSLQDLEILKGCEILIGNLYIQLGYRINFQELIDNLKDVREITGFLKVYNSPHLTSLKFFKNLEKIHGKHLEHEHYALVLYNNPKLGDIWPMKKNVELVHGGIYIYLNERLCNRIIRNFKNNVKHDHSLDSIYKSDVEVLCSPEKLILGLEDRSHKSFKITWVKDHTTDEVEVLYQPVVGNKPLILEDNKINIPICDRINWQRELISSKDLPQNVTHYFFVVENLVPHTQYRYLVKTFGKEDSYESRSELKLITTQPDIPVPPLIQIYKKSFDSLSVHWYYENREDQMVDFYRLEVYEIADKKELLDQRDYCEDAFKAFDDFHNEDYDDCCSRRLEDKEDTAFKSQLKREFACSIDQIEYCERSSLEDKDSYANTLLSKRLEHRETNYTIRSLERYRTYSLQIQACNHAGCGSFNIITDRTNYSLAADRVIGFAACKMENNNEFRVRFKEPRKPNGLIVSYTLHFRRFDSTKGPYLSHIHCLTRAEHESNRYLFVAHLNESLNQVAVRVQSLGHRLFTEWTDIIKCSDSKEEMGAVGAPKSPLWSIVVVFTLLGIGGAITWICYKRKCWRTMGKMSTFMRRRGVSFTSVEGYEPDMGDDRQILVEGVDRVRFLNTPEDDADQ